MIALCVGHSRGGDAGASGLGGVSEWTYNLALARRVAELLTAGRVPSCVISRYEGRGYAAAMLWLARELKRLGATAAVELHFNSCDNGMARGHEWLYHRESEAGRMLATLLRVEMELDYKTLPSRGIKTVIPGGRGWEFCKRTHCPAVIAEPFFGSSARDWLEVATHPESLAETLANALAGWQKGGRP